MSMTSAKFEQAILSLQWHKGFMGMGRGFDDKMMTQIQAMGSQGYALKAALTQPDPTWFTLFYERQVG